MNERPFRDELRSAFENMTRPPHPALVARIRDELEGPPRSRGLRLAALLAAALALIVIVGLLATGRMGVVPPPAPPAPASSQAPRQAPSQAPTEAPGQTPAPPAGAAATPAAPRPGFTCAAVSGGGAGPARVTAVRVGAQSGYDRFVIQFDGPVPEYEVHAQPGSAFVQDASGATVTLAGSSGLLVTLRNTSSAGSYPGPTDLPQPNLAMVREARQVGEFEGVVHWGLGLSQPACYRVTTLSGPSRLVIDVQS